MKTVDKPLPRGGKRDAPKEAPSAAAAPRRDFNERTGGFNQENRRKLVWIATLSVPIITIYNRVP